MTMNNKFNQAIRQMLIQIFRPLVKIMLRLNVPFHEVADVLRWTYVDVANTHFGINGKAPTKSRISVITGLSRTQVDKQMKTDLLAGDDNHNVWHRAVRVLTGWVEDKDFVDPEGQSKVIPLESANEPDFKTLVERYSGGSTYRSILDDLVISGAAEVNSNQVKLLRPYYLTKNDPDDLQKIDFLGVSTQYLIETIDHNINPNCEDPKFQRIVYHDHLPKHLYNIAESYVRDKSQALANDVDEYLAHLIRHANHESDEETIPYVGMGLYFYSGECQQQQTNSQ